MFWIKNLLGSLSKSTKQTMPTVKADPSSVTTSIKVELGKAIKLLENLDEKHFDHVYDAAVSSVTAGRDLHLLFTALMQIEGMTKSRAEEIAHALNNKATALINRDRQIGLGIKLSIWMYSAPCMRNPKKPTEADIQQDAAHRMVNGTQYEISKGLLVNGKSTWPGAEDGCRCSSRAVLPY